MSKKIKDAINSPHDSFVKRCYSGIIYILDVDEKNDTQELMEALIAVARDKKEVIVTAATQLRKT